jgi:hypothetical protein
VTIAPYKMTWIKLVISFMDSKCENIVDAKQRFA